MEKVSVPEHVAHYHYQKALAGLLPDMGKYIAKKLWESLSLEDQGNLIVLVSRDLETYQIIPEGRDERDNLVHLGLAVKITYKGICGYLECTEIGYQVWEEGEQECLRREKAL